MFRKLLTDFSFKLDLSLSNSCNSCKFNILKYVFTTTVTGKKLVDNNMRQVSSAKKMVLVLVLEVNS